MTSIFKIILLLFFVNSLVSMGNTCLHGEFTCNNGKCLEQTLVCDGSDSCGDNSDEVACTKRSRNCWSWQEHCEDERCTNGTFQCKNGKCIDTRFACDKFDHCGDGSDEIRHVAGFKCPMGHGGDICVLPQLHIGDGYEHCNNEDDEAENRNGKRRVFHCFDRSMVISTSQQCDGIVDCRDLSDECPCEDRVESLCGRYCTSNTEWGMDNCTPNTFVCQHEEVPKNKICDGHLDCGSENLDERFCSSYSTHNLIRCPGDVNNQTTIVARLCDGRPECFDLSDECDPSCTDTKSIKRYCNIGISRNQFTRECKTNSSAINITVQHICDGKWSECRPRIREEEMDCIGRFYCRSDHLISIDNALKCNGYEDCDDGSDEENCKNRYLCDDGPPYSVPMKFVADGVQDCRKGSDECPRDLDDSAVGSKTHLIKEPFFQFWIWFVGICCIFGNGYMIFGKVKQFSQIRKMDGIMQSNHLFLFNLAIADSLMAIYLIGISIKHIMVSGRYCNVDVAWRTGETCIMLGAICIISSQASVFMMTLLTTLRLVSVHHPITTRNIKVRWGFIATGLAWFCALILGFIPLSSFMKEDFTFGVFIPSKFISSRVAKLKEVRRFATLLSMFSPNTSAAVVLDYKWTDLNEHIEENFPAHGIRGFYGYYSQHSVCLPNFYVTTKSDIWGYSLAIILTNFLIFIYIMLAYCAIYRKSTRSKIRSTATDRGKEMQKKVIRLIVTDLCCWLPVCIIAVLNFSGAITVGSVVYAATAIIILPINSVLNPLLYSNLLDVIWGKRTKIRKMLSFSTSRSTQITN